VDDVDREIGGHGEAHPPVIERTQSGPEFVERISVEHPDEAAGGEAVTERLRKPARDSASGFGHDFIIA
jgi:hypothetical protein